MRGLNEFILILWRICRESEKSLENNSRRVREHDIGHNGSEYKRNYFGREETEGEFSENY